jgi:cysteine desulfurase family protein
MNALIYLDNAATSFPKPPGLLARMAEEYGRMGFSPGRGGYDGAVQAEAFVQTVRRKVARLFGVPDPARVVFAANATDALNLAFNGLLQPGNHVVATRLEHNSVLRPLEFLKKQKGIEYDLVPFDGAGRVDPADVDRAIRPNTRLVVVSQTSNVLGAIQDVAGIGHVCEQKGVPLLVDAAQGAGQAALDMAADGVSLVAFTGHKALMGPTGIGGLAASPGLDIRPSRVGGTGMESHRLDPPDEWPHRLEAGTLNLLGIIGLGLGLDFLEAEGREKIQARETDLAQRLWSGLAGVPGVELYGPGPGPGRAPMVLANLEGWNPLDVGVVLDGDFNIAVRAGLHCAPLVHQDLGTLNRGGAVRFSLGPFNTADDIDRTIAAVSAMVRTR